MPTLNQDFLSFLFFNSEQLSTLRTIGEYQGKQELYFKQSPEILKGLSKSRLSNRANLPTV